MSKRAAATEQTRGRIVQATMSLHDEQGVGATSWEEIAQRAGVGVGTVYRHFPSLDELLPACGAPSMQRLAPPDPGDAPARFAGIDDAPERLHRLVAEVFAMYERGAVIVEVIARERELHPALAEAHALVEESIDALVREALRPLRPTAIQRKAVRALVDVGTWRAYVNCGMSYAAARATAGDVLAAWLAEPRPAASRA